MDNFLKTKTKTNFVNKFLVFNCKGISFPYSQKTSQPHFATFSKSFKQIHCPNSSNSSI